MVRASEQQMIDDSRRAGRELALAFQNGATPHPVGVRLALQPGESRVGQISVVAYQFLEGDGSYMKRSGGWVVGGGLRRRLQCRGPHVECSRQRRPARESRTRRRRTVAPRRQWNRLPDRPSVEHPGIQYLARSLVLKHPDVRLRRQDDRAGDGRNAAYGLVMPARTTGSSCSISSPAIAW